MLQILRITAIIGSIPLVLLAAFFFWASAGSYAKDQYNQIINYSSVEEITTDTSLNKAFTVASYNIGYLSGLANAASRNQSMEPSQQLFADNQKTAIAALQNQNLDFIGLQEIDIASKRSYYVNQVTELANALAFRAAVIGITWDMNYIPYPFFPISAHFGRTVAGQAILSRHPIQTSERIVLEKVKSQPFYYRAFYLDRIAQVAQIDVNGTLLVLINVHLEAFDQPTRLRQTQVVKDLAERYATDYPVLLIGDFNSSLTRSEESNPSINLLLNSQRLKSAVPPEQLREPTMATYPSSAPTYTLDYIFYNPDRIEALEATVVQEAAQASDHLPIMMKFRFR